MRKLFETLRIAAGSLFANRLRTLLASLGIMIGIAAVSTLLSVGQSFQKFTQKQFEGLDSDVIIIQAQPSFNPSSIPATQGRLTEADAKALRQVPNVAEVVVSYRGSGELMAGSMQNFAEIIGVETNYLYGEAPPVLGRFLTNVDLEERSRVVVLSWGLAQLIFPDGRPLGRELMIRGLVFEVVGVLPGEENQFMNPTFALVPISTARDRLFPESITSPSKFSDIAVHVRNTDQLDITQQQIVQVLREVHRLRPEQGDDFMIQDFSATVETTNNILLGFTAFLGVIGGIALLVGGIGITNIMLVSVTERTQEIGLRKAVGAKRRDILLQFLIEAIVLSLVGGLGGLLISAVLVSLGAIGVQLALTDSGLAPFLTLDINAVILALVFASLVGVVAGIYPAIRASRLTPIVALRSA
jgi:putative ABC transport system permease protein